MADASYFHAYLLFKYQSFLLEDCFSGRQCFCLFTLLRRTQRNTSGARSIGILTFVTLYRRTGSSSMQPRTVTRVWIVTRHMKCWRKKNKRNSNTLRDLFAVVSLHSLWLHLTVPASGYECYIAREKRKHLTAYTQENKSSCQPRGKIGKVMRQSRPASRARNSGRRWQRDSHEQWRHIRKFNAIQVFQHMKTFQHK